MLTFRWRGLLRFPLGNEIRNPRIRASGVIRRVTQSQNVFIRAMRKALNLAKCRVLQLLAQQGSEMGTAFGIVSEGLS